MSAKLHISESLSLPRDAVTQTLIVYGGKGMGKTNFATVLSEELDQADLRFSVIDPMGVFYGLRHSKNGKGPGIEIVILGGKHGDIPIEPTGGAVVADFVADEDANTVIDISRHPNGKMWTVGERIRFVADYCTRLYERQGEKRRPILQIIDEAARFVPQQIPHGAFDIARCSGAVSILVEEGRNVGIGVCLITQRSARMNKAVSELADCMIAFRIIGPLSIGAVLDWFGEHVEKSRWKQLLETLRTLPRGNALVVSPGWLQFEGTVQIRERETFDSSATPKAGHERKTSGKGAKPDLTRYLERMKETIERQKENDPAELKKRIRGLQQELEKRQAKPVQTSAPPANTAQVAELRAKLTAIARRERTVTTALGEVMKILARVTAVGFDDAAIAAFTSSGVMDAAAKQIGALAKKKLEQRATELESLKKQISGLRSRVDALLKPGQDEPIKVGVTVTRKPTLPGEHLSNALTVRSSRPRPIRPREPGAAEGNGNVSASQLRILSAVAQFRAIGRAAAPKQSVAILAKASPTSSSFGNNLGALRSAGYIDYPKPGTVALTEEGLKLAPPDEPPSSPEEMLERCKSMASNSQARILDALFAAYPKAMDKAELADAVQASLTSSSFGNNLGALRTAGMIDYPSKGQVKLESWIMLEEAA